MSLSLHIIVDNCPQERLDRALLYLQRTKQTAVCIGGGAQLDRTMQYIERVRLALPNITIMFRLLEDTGIAIKLDTQQWYDRYVPTRSQWLHDNRVTIVVDNETSGDDNIIRTYVQRSIAIANKLHAIGIAGAYCRFATGNIQESQYALLKPLLDVLSPFDFVSPNEYSNAPGKSSGGHLERFKRIEAVAGKQLNVSIGECGILNNYEANNGYRNIGMTGVKMAEQLLSEEVWYRGGSIPRFMFCIGGYQQWNSLQIGDDVLTFLEGYYAQNPIHPPIVTIPPLPPPAPVPAPVSQLGKLKALRTGLQSNLDMLDNVISVLEKG